MKKYIAYNIEWDTDNDKAIFNQLPKEIEIPEEVWKEYEEYQDEDIISDYLSDDTGFCLFGFDLKVVDDKKEEKIMNNIYDILVVGGTYHNDNGKDYIILAFDKDADIAIFLNPENNFTPYVGAKFVRFGSWGSGHYFKTFSEANDWYNKETNSEFESVVKNRANICITIEGYNDGFYSYKKDAMGRIDNVINKILDVNSEAEIVIDIYTEG